MSTSHRSIVIALRFRIFIPLILFALVLAIAIFRGAPGNDERANVAAAPDTATSSRGVDSPAVVTATGSDHWADFRQWLAERPGYADVTPETHAENIAAGMAHARTRRPHMERMIRENPEKAFAEALTFAEWDALPPEVQAFVEKPFSLVADYDFYPVCTPPGSTPRQGTPAYVAALNTADGTSLETFVYGSRRDLTSKKELPAQGIALGKLAAMRDGALQALAPAEVPAARKLFDTTQADSGRSFATGEMIGNNAVHAVSGGRLLVFANLDEITAANERLAQADARPGPVAASSYLLPSGEGEIDWDQLETFADEQASTWTETKKKIYVIRVNFTNNLAEPVTQAAASGVLNGTVSDQIRAMSYGKTWIEAAVSANLYTMPQTTTYYVNGGTGLNSELLRDARNTFRNTKSGADAAINIGPVNETGNGGNGASGGLGDYDIVGVTFVSIGMASGGVTYAGLAGQGSDTLWIQGNNQGNNGFNLYVHELGHNYGVGHASSWDTSDGSVVGTGSSTVYGDIFDIMGGAYYPEGQFHTQAKSKLDWLTTAQWADATAQGSNTYRIHRIDDAATTSTALRGVRVTKAVFPAEYYWLGYRTAFTQYPSLQKGIYLNWQRPGQTSCWLLDTTPNSTGGKTDATLSLGRTYRDSAANLSVTALAIGGSGADRWIDVRVNLGPFPGNNAPVAGAISGPSSVAARTNASFTSSSSDQDGDSLAYDWNTKDGLVNENSASLTHTWVAGGSYTVDLTVSDMKDGVRTVSKTVTVTDPLNTWTQQTSGSTGYLCAAVWGKDRFVVADLYGAVLTSWDGVTWTNVGELPDFDKEPRLACGNGVFVAVGKKTGADAAQVCYSPDGRTWSTASFPAGVPQIRDVAFSNNQFVAVGDSGTVLTSPDGITWSLTSVSGAPAFRCVTHDGSVWMAIANNISSTKDETVWTSANSASWTQHEGLGFQVYGLTAKAGVLYVVGWYGGIKYSTDHGLTWQKAATPDSTSWSTKSIAIAPDGTFLVTAKAMDESGYPHALLVSTNGTEWTRGKSGTNFAWDTQALVYGFGRFLSSAAGGVIRTSDGFYTGNTAPSASITLAPASVSARDNRLYAGTATDADGDALTCYWDFGMPGLVADGTSVVKSFDFGGTYTGAFRVCDGKGGLTTLTQSVTVNDPARNFVRRTSGTTTSLNAITANGSVAVAVGGNGGIIRTSTDGIAWTTRTVSNSTNIIFRGATWDGAKFIIVGQDYRWETINGWVGVIYTSADGISWTRRYLGSTANTELHAVASDGTAAVAVGNCGTILESTTGLTWTPVTVAALTSTTIKGVAFGGGSYVLTGHSNTSSNGTPKVFNCTDRTNWIDVTSGSGLDSWHDMRKIAWLGDRFVSSGLYSKLRVSTNVGTTFTTTRADWEETPALAYGDNIYFAAGVNLSASNADVDLLSLDGTTWTRSAAPTTDDRNGAVFFKHTFITVGANGSIWQSSNVTPGGGAPNTPPVFSGYATSTPYQTSVAIPLSALLASASDANGDAILITASGNSTQGGSTVLEASSILYTPPAGYTGADSFPITLTDARGATIPGTVSITITITATTDPTLAMPPTIAILPGNGGVKIDFTGLPNASYQVQRSINLSAWTTLESINASPAGAVSFTDPSPPAGKAFYRIRNH